MRQVIIILERVLGSSKLLLFKNMIFSKVKRTEVIACHISLVLGIKGDFDVFF